MLYIAVSLSMRQLDAKDNSAFALFGNPKNRAIARLEVRLKSKGVVGDKN